MASHDALLASGGLYAQFWARQSGGFLTDSGRRSHVNIGNWINAFRPADGPPPQTLGAFMRWCLSGAWPALWFAAAISALAGVLEAGTALILGWVIDAAVISGPDTFFDGRNTVMIAFSRSDFS